MLWPRVFLFNIVQLGLTLFNVVQFFSSYSTILADSNQKSENYFDF